jgi:hypothetical protein
MKANKFARSNSLQIPAEGKDLIFLRNAMVFGPVARLR